MANLGLLIFGGVCVLGAFVGYLIYKKEYCKVHKTWRKRCGCK